MIEFFSVLIGNYLLPVYEGFLVDFPCEGLGFDTGLSGIGSAAYIFLALELSSEL